MMLMAQSTARHIHPGKAKNDIVIISAKTYCSIVIVKGVLARVPAHEIEKTVTDGLQEWLSHDSNLVPLFTSTAAQTLKWISNSM